MVTIFMHRTQLYLCLFGAVWGVFRPWEPTSVDPSLATHLPTLETRYYATLVALEAIVGPVLLAYHLTTSNFVPRLCQIAAAMYLIRLFGYWRFREYFGCLIGAVLHIDPQFRSSVQVRQLSN